MMGSTVYSRSKTKGFTLIELLVVITLIGILAVLGLNSFTRSQERARDVKRKADLDQIKKSLELYQQDQNPISYPAGITYDELGVVLSSYMTVFPSPPKEHTGEVYYYSSPRVAGDSLTYELYACLENEDDLSRDGEDGETLDKCDTTGYVSYTVIEP